MESGRDCWCEKRSGPLVCKRSGPLVFDAVETAGVIRGRYRWWQAVGTADLTDTATADKTHE